MIRKAMARGKVSAAAAALTLLLRRTGPPLSLGERGDDSRSESACPAAGQVTARLECQAYDDWQMQG